MDDCARIPAWGRLQPLLGAGKMIFCTLRAYVATSGPIRASTVMSLGSSPEFRFVGNESHRSLLVQLREAVAPVLANNLLPHFTDHSVTHSDNLVQLAGALAEPLQNSEHRLSDDELTVLYAACYLHDIGMQYERAGDTQVIQRLKLESPWEELSEATRRDLLRIHHNLISAEMVQASVNSSAPPIGIQLGSRLDASSVACLCAAHCIDSKTEQYDQLIQDRPRMRMKLLSGLLRLADILDESRRRASREKARTLLLDLTAQTHWWRHFYTQDVQFLSSERVVRIWFDFPPGSEAEYARIVPDLQMPWIEQEFARHRAVFTRYGFGWTVEQKVASNLYSNVEEMPPLVMTEMLKQLRARRQQEEAFSRLAALEQFDESRPHIERRLAALRAQKESLSPGDYLRQLAAIAFDLWDLGGKRSSRMILDGPFERDSQHLSESERMAIGTRLIEMLNEDRASFEAAQIVRLLRPVAEHLEDDHPMRRRFRKAAIDTMVKECAYDEAVVEIERALPHAGSERERRSLQAIAEEMHLLQGEHVRLERPSEDVT